MTEAEKGIHSNGAWMRKVRGLQFSVLEALGTLLLSILSISITARLLSPIEVGEAALAMSIVGIVQILCSLGLIDALVRAPSHHTKLQDGIFWFGLVAGLSGCMACIALSYPIRALYEDHLLGNLILFCSLSCIIQGVGIVPSAALIRKMRMRQLLYSTLLGKVAGVAVTATTAWYSWGAWSLVTGYVFTHLVAAIYLWARYPRRIKLRCSIREIRPLISFGILISVEAILWSLGTRAFTLVLGLVHGTNILGLFSFSAKISEEVSNIVYSMVGRVAVPYLTDVHRRKADARSVFLEGTRVIATCVFPIFIGLACIADDLFHIAFSEKWLAAVPIFQVLCVSSSFLTALVLGSTILRLEGKQLANIIGGIADVTISSLALLATTGLSVLFVTIGYACRLLFTVPLKCFFVSRTTGVSILQQIAPLLCPLGASVVMGVAIQILQNTLAGSSELSRIASTMLFGSIVYLIALALIDWRSVKRIMSLARSSLRG